VKKIRRHTEEFKREAVSALESRGNLSIDDVAKGLGIRTSQLHVWSKSLGAEALLTISGGHIEQEVARLHREVAGLRKDRDVLKTSIAYLQVERSRAAIRELNERFRSGHLIGKSFYAQLGLHGCDPSRSVLVTVVPEGSNTFSGQIIKQDGSVVTFDIDLDSPELSRWEDCSQDFQQERQGLVHSRPWAESVVAFELFQEINGL
jgi:transposase